MLRELRGLVQVEPQEQQVLALQVQQVQQELVQVEQQVPQAQE